MEGCLYKNIQTEKYYLLNTVAYYNSIVVDLETFNSCFIQHDDLSNNYEKIEFNSNNLKQLLDKYIDFKNRVDYDNLNDFNYIKYDNIVYNIKNWYDVLNFIASQV